MPSPSQVIDFLATEELPSEMISETVLNHQYKRAGNQFLGNELSTTFGLRVKMVLVHECFVCAKKGNAYDNIALQDDCKHMRAKNRRHTRKEIEYRWKEEIYYKYLAKATELGAKGEVAEKVGLEAAMEMELLIEEVNLTERLEIANIKKAKRQQEAEREKAGVRALGSDCAVQAAAMARGYDGASTEVLAMEAAKCDEEAVCITGSKSASEVADTANGWQTVNMMVAEAAEIADFETKTVWDDA